MTVNFKKNFAFSIVAFLAITFTFQSCNSDDDAPIVEPIQFGEIENIATFHGNRESDIVIINTQGGPVTTLEDDQLNTIRKDTETENVLYVNVHQAQTLDPSKFTQTDITFDEAKAYDAESIANLKKVVSFFKEGFSNKKVYVLGISFGAFMAQELIVKHGIDVADGYLIMVGRLNIDEEFWMGFSEGKGGLYTYDDQGVPSFTLEDQSKVEDRNMSRLAAGLGMNRYMTEMADIADLSKITYVTGTKDEQVGVLTLGEGQFLENKGASVNVVEDGNHGESIDAGLAQLLKSTFNIN